MMKTSRRILIVTPDTIGERMAGPAIRAWEIAKVLSHQADVRLVSTVGASGAHADFEIVQASKDALRPHAEWADVIVIQGHILRSHPWLKELDKIIVADIYGPLHLEQLEQGKDLPVADRYAVAVDAVEVMNDQLERADFMVCASEKQRDFWLGQLAGLTRVNPATYDEDNSLRSLLDVAPFGLPDDPPVLGRHAIRGAVPGISDDDHVIVWGGGIYNWFDPLTLISAVGTLSRTRPSVRLYFLGVRHPNPDVPTMDIELRARELAASLQLTNRHVFFNEDWVRYEERADYLLDADLGVSTHFQHIETAYSFRTRMLDYLWAGLPIVGTTGDTFAELIDAHGLGLTVPPEDADALAEALERLLFDTELAKATRVKVRRFAATMTWPRVLEPLARFCADPRVAPDRRIGVISERNRILADLRKRVAGMESSTSWRITAPLRSSTDRLRRRNGRDPSN
jgi:glycosyltransferase involved in cell wall biosynthesis